MRSVQISHDELLLLLGLLRLPMPLALGEDPSAGYTDETLNAAMTSAMGSLLARRFLLDTPVDSKPPAVAPALEDLVSASALATSTLMVAARQGRLSHASHYSLRNGVVVAHTSPQERVHRLEELQGLDMVVDHLMVEIAPVSFPGAGLDLAVRPEPLGMAIEAVGAGQQETAHRLLVTDGVASDVAGAFVTRLGADVTRYALVAVRGLQHPQPEAESVVVLQGSRETWFGIETGGPQPRVELQSVAPDELRGRLNTFVRGLTSAA